MLFFFISGATALVYELLWSRLTGLVFGNTTFAIATVLAAYMAGLGLGSFLIGRPADRWRKPLFAYGCLEIAIGAYAALTFPLLHLVQTLYVAFARLLHPSLGLFTAARLGLSFLLLFIPTFLMGATLPVLARFYIRRAEAIGSGTALLYGLNTAGAVTGTLLAGFLLLPILGMGATLKMAVTLNVGIGLFACLLSRTLTVPDPPVPGTAVPGTVPLAPVRRGQTPLGFDHRWIPAALAVSGITAMLYEVGWTRILAAVLGSSTYAFTLMLATFLLGLALGSAAVERILARRPARIRDWGWLQVAIALAGLSALPLFERLGIVTVRLFALTVGHPAWFELLKFGACAGLMIGPTFCFGALLPVSAALYTTDPNRVGERLGALYLANTFGNILGSLAAGFLLIPMVGIHQTLWIASAVGGALGCGVLLVPDPRVPGTTVPGTARRWGAALLLLGGLWQTRGGWDPRLVTSGLHVHPYLMTQMSTEKILGSLLDRQVLFYREGTNSIVSVLAQDEERVLKVNGKSDASSGGDMGTQILLGHLPHLIHPNPRRSLLIGFGSGTTLHSILLHPVTQVDCAEIEPAVLEAAPYFDSVNHQAYRDPRVRLITNDARNHLLIEQAPYDVIVSEPSNPWMAGVSNLFTVDFYRLARRRLSDGGIFCQWLQAYTIAPDDVRMVVASLKEAFPCVSVWTSLPGDMILLASERPIVVDLARIQERLDRSPEIRADLKLLGIRKAEGLLSSFLLAEEDVDGYVEESPLNTDDQLLLEFSTPWALYENRIDLIVEDLISHRDHPLPRIAGAGSSVPILDNPDALAEMASGYLATDRTDLARSTFQRALSLDPRSVPALIGRGWTAFKDGQRPQAIENFEKGLQEDPRSAEAKGALGHLYLREGHGPEGLKLLHEAQELDPTHWDFFIWEATALENLQQWEEAVQAYRRALNLKPNDLKSRLGLARCLNQSGRPDQAVRLLDLLHRQFITNERITMELSRVYERMGQLQAAIAAWEDLVRINPYLPERWLNLARLYAKAGDQQGLRRAIREGKRGDIYFIQRLKNFGARASATAAGTASVQEVPLSDRRGRVSPPLDPTDRSRPRDTLPAK
ncbi:MAG: fused MFS/spermidine synthase [Candidatus Omnitrophica bacterium]|nr:fused MFS/spermidine synthase [Candidatus Omnitrophota bacterium]